MEARKGESLEEEQVSNQLHLKSSEVAAETQTLNKRAVLNRIRDYKCIYKIKSLLLTSVAGKGTTALDADNRWIDNGDIFSCP